MCAFMYSLLRSDTSASHILLFLVYTGVLFFFFFNAGAGEGEGSM